MLDGIAMFNRLRPVLWHRAMPYLVLVIGLGMTALAWQLEQSNVDADSQVQFNNSVQTTQVWVERRMGRFLDALVATRGLFVSSEHVTREEFGTFVASLMLKERYPGLAAIQYAPRVTPDTLDVFHERLRAAGLGGHRVWGIGGRHAPPGDAEEYFPVEYREPFALPALALDVGSAPMNRQALARARDSGEPALGARIARLVEDPPNQPGFLAFVAVYRNGMSIGSVGQRRAALQGYVIGVFHAADLLADIYDMQQPPPIDFEVFDGALMSMDTLLYDDRSMYFANASFRPRFKATRSVVIGGRNWTLYFVSLPGFGAGLHNYLSLWILASGALISILLFGIAWVQVRARARAEHISADLRQSQARLAQAQHIGRMGSWGWDVARNEVAVSNEACRIFRCDAQPTHVLTMDAFLGAAHPDDRELLKKAMETSLACGAVLRMDHRIVLPDGSERIVHERAHVIYDDAGVPQRMIGTVQDITERKLAEEALFREKERAQVTLQSIGDAVITTDAEARVDYMNPVAEQLTGWSADEAKGQPLVRVFNAMHEDTREPQGCPATLVLREPRTVGLASNTVLVRRDGVEFSIEDSTAPIRDRRGEVIGAVLVFHDVSHARGMANQLAYQASHDPLTGLLNRREFEVSIKQALERVREGRTQHAVCYIDLDQFKVVNDTCGHVAGDELLKQFAGRLQQRVRGNDILARLGGDEFGVLLDGCPLDKAKDIADDLCATAKKFRFAWQGKTFDVGVSIGLVSLNGESVSLAEVLSAADSACYVAKDEGRNRVHVYQADDNALARHRGEMQWVSHIRQALEEDRLYLYYQTMQPLDDRAVTEHHIEVLLRMKGRDGQLVLPRAFIPAAERYNLVTTLDRWVIGATFDFLECLSENGKGPQLATCAVNLSGQSLCEDSFLDFVIEQLQRMDIQPAQICFEITETAAVTNLSRAMCFISMLKGMGCRFALDDFGSGLSSFGYLKNLPVDYLKIDGAFIKDMADDAIDRAMVESINNIGHVMHIQTIAEWVESETVLELAKQIGIDFAQGFAISLPRPLWSLLDAPPDAGREGENSTPIR